MVFCIYGASSKTIDKSFIEAGEKLGKRIAERNHGIVFGGGATGMMGAVARGVDNAKGYLLGIAPRFFNADGILYNDCSEFVYTKTMRERKKALEENADAFIVTPGGVGTFDEFFEIFTLRQLAQHTKAITIYNVNGYFNPMLDMMEMAIKQNFMTEKNKELYFVSDDPDKIIDYIENYNPDNIDLSELKNITK